MRAGNVVLDASATVVLVADDAVDGQWVTGEIAGARLMGPRLLPFEVGNALRRRVLAGTLTAARADAAHSDLTALPLRLWAHSSLAKRAWELRGAVTYYDACYVALAELLDAPLVTLDARLARAPGPRCAFLTPPEEL